MEVKFKLLDVFLIRFTLMETPATRSKMVILEVLDTGI